MKGRKKAAAKAPALAIGQLQDHRAAALRENLARLSRDLEAYSGALPRVTLLDDEYLRAVTAAELSWVSGVVDDLRAGTLKWGEELADMASSFLPDGLTG